jgi:hypothetical protein
MAFKPNYNQQRAERTRAKQAKKEAKQRELDEERARRKAAGEAPLPEDGPADRDAGAEHDIEPPSAGGE